MQFINSRIERNVVLKIAAPQMPVDIGIQCSKDPFGRTDEYITSGKETIRAPSSPAAVDVLIGGARDHPQTTERRRHFWNSLRNGGRLSIHRYGLLGAPEPEGNRRSDQENGGS